MSKNNNTLNLMFLLGFGAVGYIIGSKLIREHYLKYPSTPSYNEHNNQCINACADRSGELKDDCMDDCRSYNMLPTRLHPSHQLQPTHGFERVAL